MVLKFLVWFWMEETFFQRSMAEMNETERDVEILY